MILNCIKKKKNEIHLDINFSSFQLEESIEKGIKEISDLKVRFKVVALNHYLNEKKKLDTELDKEIKLLTKKYEDLSHPLFLKVMMNFL